jgi:hypothetical protein
VWRIVVDVQETQQLVAVQQGRGAERVEPLLDDGRADIAGPRVVAVPCGVAARVSAT